MADGGRTHVCLATASRSGAVAVLQLMGGDVQAVLQRITGRGGFEPGRVYLAKLAGIDRGVVGLLRDGREPVAQLMPHGGPRVVQLILEKLAEIGVSIQREPDPLALYPEADSPIQADVLHATSQAASPAAIDRLLAQPQAWRNALREPSGIDRKHIARDSGVLDQLIDPPTVVVVGRPNVGKSTLTNRLMGRTVSLVADLPGTTRDWVGAVFELGGIRDAVAVRWLDTPGLRASDDTVEQRAIVLARQVIESAQVLIVMRDPQTDWPEADVLPREPDLRVVNKIDEPGDPDAWPAAIQLSAQNGRGVDVLQQQIIERLGLHQVRADCLWAFSDRLRAFVENGREDLMDYLGT